jgi:Response regulator containing a CheY-like receiver domain and an HTH DNA-binding domain
MEEGVQEFISKEAIELYVELVSGDVVLTEGPNQCSRWEAMTIEELVRNKLVRNDVRDPMRLVPVSPEAASATLSLLFQQKIVEQQELLTRSQVHLRDLKKLYEERWSNHGKETVRVLRGAQEICSTTLDIVTRAAKEAHVIMATPVLKHRGCLVEILRTIGTLHDNGVQCMVTCDSAIIADREADGFLRQIAERCDDVRLLSKVSMQMWIVDGEQTLITHHGEVNQLVVISQPMISQGLGDLFADLHRQGVPYGQSDPADERTLSPAQRRVLSLLALGQRDSEIAQCLQISERTVRRYVADLLQRLGALSRFHAALIACRRGLV